MTKWSRLGGLHIVGTERHESRRIDNQLRGRAGRQGDPGSARFYLSLQDDLMRIFGGARMQKLMLRLGMEEDVPIESRLITKRIAAAQKAVEAQNFAVAKARARIRRRDEQAAPGRVLHAPAAAGGREPEGARHRDHRGHARPTLWTAAVPKRLGPNEWDWAGLQTEMLTQFGVKIETGALAELTAEQMERRS